MAAYSFAQKLKTLNGLTPYEYICKIWTSEPDRFIIIQNHNISQSAHHHRALQKSELTMIRFIVLGD